MVLGILKTTTVITLPIWQKQTEIYLLARARLQLSSSCICDKLHSAMLVLFLKSQIQRKEADPVSSRLHRELASVRAVGNASVID